jgi:hypothetical protein
MPKNDWLAVRIRELHVELDQRIDDEEESPRRDAMLVALAGLRQAEVSLRKADSYPQTLGLVPKQGE